MTVGDGTWAEGRATAAGVYDYWLGGKDNFAADRRVGEEVAGHLPGIVTAICANRLFLVRAVRYLAMHGITQFLDVGTGYPTPPNVHQVAQQVAPAARVVYVDKDPAVAAHGRARLADDRTIMVEGDAGSPLGILQNPEVADHLDWSRPVGVLMVAVLHFLTDEQDPRQTVATFRDAMAPGSALAISHVTPGTPRQAAAMRDAVAAYQALTGPIVPRTPEIVRGWLDGFDLTPPELTRIDQWRVPGGDTDWWPIELLTRRLTAHGTAPVADDVFGVAGVGWLRESGTPPRRGGTE